MLFTSILRSLIMMNRGIKCISLKRREHSLVIFVRKMIMEVWLLIKITRKLGHGQDAENTEMLIKY